MAKEITEHLSGKLCMPCLEQLTSNIPGLTNESVLWILQFETIIPILKMS